MNDLWIDGLIAVFKEYLSETSFAIPSVTFRIV